MPSMDQRKVAFIGEICQADLTQLRETAAYIRLHISSRQRPGLSLVVELLASLEDRDEDVTANTIGEYLWRAIEHVNIDQVWLYNTTIRPVLLLIVAEAQCRQNLLSSTAERSLNSQPPPVTQPSTPARAATSSRLLRFLRHAS